MKKNKNKKNTVLSFIFLVTVAVAIFAVPFGYITWTDSNLEWIFSSILNKQVNINNFISGVVAFLGGIPMFIINLIVSVLR